jgi:hypothetical protein
MSPIAPSTAIAVTDARQRHQPQRVGVADRVSAEDLVELIDLAAGEVDLAQAVRGFKMPVHAAARWYSWMSPPSRSRRLIW